MQAQMLVRGRRIGVPPPASPAPFMCSFVLRLTRPTDGTRLQAAKEVRQPPDLAVTFVTA